MIRRTIILMICFGFAAHGEDIHAQAAEEIQVQIRYLNVSPGFFERVGIDIQWQSTELQNRSAILTDIVAYFLLSGGRNQNSTISRTTTWPRQWTLFRTPESRFVSSGKTPQWIKSREIGFKVELIGDEKVRIETCEIDNNRFVNSTSSFAVLASDEVALIPIESHGFICIAIVSND